MWQELQVERAGLVPAARHVIATESGHYIHVEQPALVTEAIREVIKAVRDPTPWVTHAGSGSPSPENQPA